MPFDALEQTTKVTAQRGKAPRRELQSTTAQRGKAPRRELQSTTAQRGKAPWQESQPNYRPKRESSLGGNHIHPNYPGTQGHDQRHQREPAASLAMPTDTDKCISCTTSIYCEALRFADLTLGICIRDVQYERPSTRWRGSSALPPY